MATGSGPQAPPISGKLGQTLLGNMLLYMPSFKTTCIQFHILVLFAKSAVYRSILYDIMRTGLCVEYSAVIVPNTTGVHEKTTLAENYSTTHKKLIPNQFRLLYNCGFLLYTDNTVEQLAPIPYLLTDLVYLLPQAVASVVLLPGKGNHTYMYTTILQLYFYILFVAHSNLTNDYCGHTHD